jgi:hypothetical protein
MRQHPVKVEHPAGCVNEGTIRAALFNGESVITRPTDQAEETWNRSFQSIATSAALLRRLPLLRIYLVRGGFGKDRPNGQGTMVQRTDSVGHKVHRQ